MPRLLIVDDSADLREIMAQALTEAGFSVSTAADGAEALELAEATTPDLILLDWIMPTMSGRQLVSALRGHDRLSGVPILVISGGSASRVVEEVGGLPVLRKPVSLERLLSAVNDLTASKRAPEPPAPGLQD